MCVCVYNFRETRVRPYIWQQDFVPWSHFMAKIPFIDLKKKILLLDLFLTEVYCHSQPVVRFPLMH